jgi:hypothetical protein
VTTALSWLASIVIGSSSVVGSVRIRQAARRVARVRRWCRPGDLIDKFYKFKKISKID